MTDTIEMTEEQRAFKTALDRFRAETQLSVASTAKLLDVNPGSMSKWFKVDKETGHPRMPQKYVMDAGMLKLQRLNANDEETGVYSQLRGMKPGDRVSLLLAALDARRSS